MKHYKFALYKSYFDTGYGITSYLKYAIALFGLTSLETKLTLIIFLFYGISCFIVGWWWFKFGYQEAQNEVGNRHNKFVKEVREKIFTAGAAVNRYTE